MPKSERHQAQARRDGPAPTPLYKYEITDPHHKPDLRGELGGAKVVQEGAKQFVYMSASAAKFYVDSGSMKLVS